MAKVPDYPPFCDLCLVKFATNHHAHLHFDGPQHRNRIMLVRKAQTANIIWCDICCCELNTQQILEAHNNSPKHLKKCEAYEEIKQLKAEYLSQLESKKAQSSGATDAAPGSASAP